jgi:hypothetical protein
MQTHVDEKGKYFTDHVTKRGMPIVASIRGAVVRGVVHLALDNRLKDEMNNGERFIAITQAQVWDASEKQMQYQTDLLIVNKEQIVWIFPAPDTAGKD